MSTVTVRRLRDDAAAELLRRLQQRRLDDADDLLGLLPQVRLRRGLLLLLDLAVAAVLEAVDLRRGDR